MLMNNGGGITRHTIDGGTTYITLAADGGEKLRNILITTAPANRISIDESVDFSLNKALSGDFLVSSFGYKPVMITINGLDIYQDNCTSGSKETVQSFYDKWNVHANKNARIVVGMATAGSSGRSYSCVLVSLQRVTAQELEVSGVGKYVMTLYGALRG